MSNMLSAWGVPWVAAVLLLATRIAALFLMTPVLYAVPLPGTVRALLTLGLAVAIALPLAHANGIPVGAAALVRAGMSEIAIGATLGLGVLAAFAGFSVAGRLLDVQIGFGIGQVFDPVSQTQVPIVTSIFNVLAVLLFFLSNAHHALLRGIAYSVDLFPVGGAWSIDAAVGPVLQQVAALFSLGFALASPVVMGLLLVEFALAVVTRNLPQINMLTLGIPVKVVVGLAMLSLLAASFGPAATRLYGGIFHTWSLLFGQASGGR